MDFIAFRQLGMGYNLQFCKKKFNYYIVLTINYFMKYLEQEGINFCIYALNKQQTRLTFLK